jgi:hypothetical protein
MVHLFNRNYAKKSSDVELSDKHLVLTVGAVSSALTALVPSSGASSSTALTVVSGIGNFLTSWGWDLLYYGAFFSLSAFILSLFLPMRRRSSSCMAQA